jgi:hypothetical protein
MKKLSVIIILLLLVKITSAQESSNPTPYDNEFGLHAGAVTGVGLSYLHWFNKTGIQLTALPPIKNDNYRLNSVGVTFLHSFVDKKYMRIFGYVGAHYWHEQDNQEVFEYDYNSGYYISTQQKVNTEMINFGFGPGASFGTRVRFSVMFGYGFYDIAGKFNTLPTGELGLTYCF